MVMDTTVILSLTISSCQNLHRWLCWSHGIDLVAVSILTTHLVALWIWELHGKFLSLLVWWFIPFTFWVPCLTLYVIVNCYKDTAHLYVGPCLLEGFSYPCSLPDTIYEFYVCNSNLLFVTIVGLVKFFIVLVENWEVFVSVWYA